jgi:hypothetical protein
MRALLAYVVLTLVLTWPMVTRLHLMDAGDSAFFAWEMAWEIHALETDPRQLPHANIFHPLRYTLGLDEPVLGTTLLALPFALFSSDAVWIFGVTRLLTFVFSAFTAFLLARELGAGPRAAFLGGAAFAFSLVRCDQIGHLSTLGTQWLPLVVLFTHRFTRTGRARDSVLAGVFFVLSALACGYHGLIALIVLPLAALPLVWKRAHLARPALAGIGVAVAGLLPLYALHRAALDPERYARGEGETRLYSASLETFLAAPWWSWLYGDLTARFRGAGNELFLGIAVLLPIAIGAWQLSRERRRPSREAVALLVMALAAALVALGPEIRVGEMRLGPGPYGWLRDAIPLFQKIRVPARAGVFLALAASMLAAKVWARWEKRPWILALCGAAVVADSLGLARPTLEGVAVVDSRHQRAALPARVSREHLHDPFHAALEAPRQRIRGHRARALSTDARGEPAVSEHGVDRPLSADGRAVRDRAFRGLRSAQVGPDRARAATVRRRAAAGRSVRRRFRVRAVAVMISWLLRGAPGNTLVKERQGRGAQGR